jgi:hypothetical protein
MCKSACEGSCSTEIAAECPSIKSIQALLIEEKMWKEFERIMRLEDEAKK